MGLKGLRRGWPYPISRKHRADVVYWIGTVQDWTFYAVVVLSLFAAQTTFFLIFGGSNLTWSVPLILFPFGVCFLASPAIICFFSKHGGLADDFLGNGASMWLVMGSMVLMPALGLSGTFWGLHTDMVPQVYQVSVFIVLAIASHAIFRRRARRYFLTADLV